MSSTRDFSPPRAGAKRDELETPKLTRRDPSLSTVVPGPANTAQQYYNPTSSKAATSNNVFSPSPISEPPYETPTQSRWRRCARYMYDHDNNTFCDRSCASWMQIISYSIMYLIFLSTYTMIFLYLSLMIIKSNPTSHEAADSLIYSPNVGITAIPTSLYSYPLVWYRIGHPEDVQMYIRDIDELILNHRRDDNDILTRLGPCGRSPYGYDEKPCVLVRINKRFGWASKALSEQSENFKDAPANVQKWAKSHNNKYWLHCDGHHPYDREHLGKIKYYPDPPGIDSGAFPLDFKARSPLLGVQLTGYTLGISLEVECTLWYDGGHSSLAFVFFVAPKNSVRLLRSNATRSN